MDGLGLDLLKLLKSYRQYSETRDGQMVRHKQLNTKCKKCEEGSNQKRQNNKLNRILST